PFGDARHAAGMKPLAGEHAHGRIEDQPALARRRPRLAAGELLPARGRAGAAHARTSSGHAYAAGLRLASEGSCSRIWSWRSRSSSAIAWPSRSGAWARMRPHGSTIIERPPER